MVWACHATRRVVNINECGLLWEEKRDGLCERLLIEVSGRGECQETNTNACFLSVIVYI